MSLKSLANVDRRIWFALMFIFVTVAYYFPMGLPVAVGKYSSTTYDLIESLEPGDVVFVNYNIQAYGWDELKGQCLSLIPHVFEQPGVKVIFFSDLDQGPLFIEETVKKIGSPMAGETGIPWYDIKGKKYMEDWINIGYYPTGGVSALSSDFRQNAFQDWYRNDINDFLDDSGIMDAGDIRMVISFDCLGGAGSFIQYWRLDWDTEIVVGQIGVSASGSINSFNVGLIDGLLISTRGAAEYQYLTGYKGMALQSMDAFSVIHMFLLAIILICNIGYWGWERHQTGGI